jgi:hypothetical protein
MADHVSSVKGSSIPAVSKDQFWASLREGYLLFCSGRAVISQAIEDATRSPWSHIAMVIRIYGQWCVLEAVYAHGVTITPIWQYIDRYDGDLVLCKRMVDGKDLDQSQAILKGIALLGREYATAGLVKEGLHRIFTDLSPEMNSTECYCSGLQWLMSQATISPFPQSPKGGAPTPEDEFTDSTVIPICVLPYEMAAAQGA